MAQAAVRSRDEGGIRSDKRPASRSAGESRDHSLPVLVGVGVVFLIIMGMLATARSTGLLTEANLLYLTLIFYAAAAVLYVSFGVTGTERSILFARLATAAGLLTNTLAAGHRWYVAGHPPFSSVYEMLLSFVWTLAALTILIEWRYGVKVIGSVTLPLATLGVILMQLLPSAVRPLVPALQSTWLHIHVTLAMLAYAACAVSFALAMMFLIQDKVRTETFLISTSSLLVAIYLGIASRFDSSGGLRVAAWDASEGREIFYAEKSPLFVVIPNLGWIFFLILATVIVTLGLTLWAKWNREAAPDSGDRGVLWANRAFFVSTVVQVLGLAALVLRAREGLYPAAQSLPVEGFFATSPAAIPAGKRWAAASVILRPPASW